MKGLGGGVSTLHGDSIGAVRGLKQQVRQLQRENERLRRELIMLRAASECVVSQAAALLASPSQDDLGVRRIIRASLGV